MRFIRQIGDALRRVANSPAAGGALLLGLAFLAIILDNSFLRDHYRAVLSYEIGPAIGPLDLHKSVQHWISDGLMVFFFLIVGLDIKKELLHGQLSSPSRAVLPAVAALGGMLVPALIFTYYNRGTPAITGWAIPSATDIAFSLAVLRVFGSWLPPSLRIFLTALAILDDLGAIVIIAVFYSDSLVWLPLLLAFLTLAVLAVLGRRGVSSLLLYGTGGVVVWALVLMSGIHATIAGVLVAFAIPLKAKDSAGRELSERISGGLSPLVTLLILPLFALANAGVDLSGLSIELAAHPVVLGIALGLFAGKQIGVFGSCWLSVRAGLCTMPAGATWPQLYGVALLTGIGFTMSLFTASLAYSGPEMIPLCTLGVLAGSLLSASIGGVYLYCLRRASGAAGQVENDDNSERGS